MGLRGMTLLLLLLLLLSPVSAERGILLSLRVCVCARQRGCGGLRNHEPRVNLGEKRMPKKKINAKLHCRTGSEAGRGRGPHARCMMHDDATMHDVRDGKEVRGVGPCRE